MEIKVVNKKIHTHTHTQNKDKSTNVKGNILENDSEENLEQHFYGK